MTVKPKLDCSTCDREHCLLQRKFLRRLLVKLLGCNYWRNAELGYIPWGESKN